MNQQEVKMTGFSVLMAVYDGEVANHFSESLESLENSSLPVSQLVLVEDGPLRDELRQIINEFRSRLPILIVRLPENRGLAAALNMGLSVCSQEYVARFDSDDINIQERFSAQIAFLNRHPTVAVVGSTIEEFDAVSGASLGLRRLPADPTALRKFAKIRSPMNHPSVMFRKSVITALGGYSNIRHLEDYSLWVRCLVGGWEVSNIDSVLVRMRSGFGQRGRRRGLSYLKSEFLLVFEFYKIGFLNWHECARFILLRAPFRMIPTRVLNRIYGRLFRA